MKEFPPSLWVPYTIRVISKFFENSRRYSQPKVHHRCQGHWWQMEKVFNQKIFFWYLWVVELIFLQIFSFKFSSLVLFPVFTNLAVWTTTAVLVAKFASGDVDTGGAPWLANISANFWKNLKTILMLFSGAWGKMMIHEKTCCKKSRDIVLLNWKVHSQSLLHVLRYFLLDIPYPARKIKEWTFYEPFLLKQPADNKRTNYHTQVCLNTFKRTTWSSVKKQCE